MKFLIERPISLEYHDKLNPLLFEGMTLHINVREKFLRFAEQWIQFAHIPYITIKDIVATGSNFNYNYNKFSDIDIHVIYDKDLLPEHIPDDYFDDKKKVWSIQHNIVFEGYPIEPYAADYMEKFPKGQGVYSLRRGDWVQAPNYVPNYMYKASIEKKADYYEDLINEMIKNKTPVSEFMTLREKFRDMRSKGLLKDGEFSTSNQIFKELRNRKVFEKMNKYMSDYYDKELSF